MEQKCVDVLVMDIEGTKLFAHLQSRGPLLCNANFMIKLVAAMHSMYTMHIKTMGSHSSMDRAFIDGLPFLVYHHLPGSNHVSSNYHTVARDYLKRLIAEHFQKQT